MPVLFALESNQNILKLYVTADINFL